MKHLILGSSGQIGKALCKYLKEQNEEIIEIDIKNGIHEDLRENENLTLHNSLEECDFVYFLAFDIGGAQYLEKYQNSYKFINNNMKIMVNTFEQLKDSKKPFIFASSQMSQICNSSYGMLKSLGEKITIELGGIVTRFWNVYDVEDNDEKSHVITDFIRMAREDSIIKMRTSGSESRQFLYGEDAAICLYNISQKYFILKQSPFKSIVDITNFRWTTVYELAEIVSKQFGMIPIIPGLKEDQTQRNAMNEPSTSILNLWQPKISLEEGIKKLINGNG